MTFFEWLRQRLKGRPSKPTNLRITSNMKTVTVKWTEPTTRVGGGALPPAEIFGTEISMKNAAGTEVVKTTVAHGVTQTLSQDLADGVYSVSAVTIDTAGQRSAPATGTATVITIPAPSPPTGLIITVA